MYQFMVAAGNGSNVTHGNSTFIGPGTDVRDISRMSLTSGTNKWASRAVIALQLAAWSAVGIVLLEKGVASLQRIPGSFNASREIPSPKSSIGNLSPDNLIPLGPDKDRTANGVEDNEYRKGSINILVETPSSSVSSANDETIETSTNDNMNSVVDKNNRTVAQSNNESMLKKVETQVDKDPEIVGDRPAMTVKGVIENWNEKNKVEEEESRWKGSKRSRFSKVVAGGATAAAAMVAVGAVMLILGPAVIILRALDERRQERRFLKLSAVEDLPPSYEQATGDGERAPTYSSLNLDTIVISPSSVHNSTYARED